MTALGSFNEILIGDERDNLLGLTQTKGAAAGSAGDDTLSSVLNGDPNLGSLLFGNEGDDYINSQGVADSVFGGKDNDTLFNDSGRVLMSGDLGDDVVMSEEGGNTLFGGGGNDYLMAEEAENIFLGGEGNDSLVGLEGDDTMAGGDGADYIKGGPDDPSLMFGNAGSDTMEAGNAGDSMYGGKDDDTVTYGSDVAGEGGVLFGDLGADYLAVLSDSISGAILNGDVDPTGGAIAGTDVGDDTLYVAAGSDHLMAGNAGDDVLRLGDSVGGGVTMAGGQGNDVFTGSSSGESFAFGDAGDDMMELSFAGGGQMWGDNPTLTDGFGNDTIMASGSGVTVAGDNENAGTAGGDDYLISQDGGNNLIGHSGNDVLSGTAAGGDSMDGGLGNDTYMFTDGDNIVFDEEGLNTYMGVNALNTTVTVKPTDEFGGEATWFVQGDQSVVERGLTSGGLITDNQAPDIIGFSGTVTGQVNTSGGDDEIQALNVASTGSVMGGEGNDTIEITGSVAAGGMVDGGAGDDLLDISTLGGAVDGAEGSDTINIDAVAAGATVSGGDGNDFFNGTNGSIPFVGAGAVIDGGAGEEKIVIQSLGSDAAGVEGAAITLTGGNDDSADQLGVGTDATSTFGTSTPAVFIDAGGGDDILQGAKYGGDVLLGGVGNDQLYGGPGPDAGDFTQFATLAQAGSMNDALAGLIQVSGGDSLDGGAGNDEFVLRRTNETGAIQGLLNQFSRPAGSNPDLAFSGTNGENVLNPDPRTGATDIGGTQAPFSPFEYSVADGASANNGILVGTDGAAITQIGDQIGDSNGSTAGGSASVIDAGYLTAGFNVDTLTGFTANTDKLVLEINAFTAYDNAGNVGTALATFNGAGALFGQIDPDLVAGTDADKILNNYDSGSAAFAGDFAKIDQGLAGVGSIGSLDDLGQVSYDNTSGGLYIGNGTVMTLMAVIPGLTTASITDANNLVDFQSEADLSAGGGFTLL
ncbi:calcium-binding protein [Geitlerinema sp. CS-897]|nr:calcium-binding protein [Geitlerinema sp. CS-897]